MDEFIVAIKCRHASFTDTDGVTINLFITKSIMVRNAKKS